MRRPGGMRGGGARTVPRPLERRVRGDLFALEFVALRTDPLCGVRRPSALTFDPPPPISLPWPMLLPRPTTTRRNATGSHMRGVSCRVTGTSSMRLRAAAASAPFRGSAALMCWLMKEDRPRHTTRAAPQASKIRRRRSSCCERLYAPSTLAADPSSAFSVWPSAWSMAPRSSGIVSFMIVEKVARQPCGTWRPANDVRA